MPLGPGQGRIASHRGAHLRDRLVDTRAAAVEQDLRPSPEPVIVRSHSVDPYRRRPIRDTKPQDLVTSEAGCSGRLHGNPGVDRQETAPRHGRGGKHLDHCLLRHGGVGREAGWIPPRLVPRNAAPRVGQSEADQHGDEVQSKQQERGTPHAIDTSSGQWDFT